MYRNYNGASSNINNLIHTDDWVTKLLSNKFRYSDIIGENKKLIGIR